MSTKGDKIKNLSFVADENDKPTRTWRIIEEVAKGEKKFSRKEKEVALIHLSALLGRTFDETLDAYNNFGDDKNPDRLFKIIYHLGNVSFKNNLALNLPVKAVTRKLFSSSLWIETKFPPA